ncbi:MAG: hypothetical protein LAT58_00970 [Opitutales bacterium]|nr:hypothetical protein [Opitutales bacterium]
MRILKYNIKSKIYKYCNKINTNYPSLDKRIEFDFYNRGKEPQYAYSIYNSAKQAKAIGYNGITIIEFGVAAGTGLLAMERLADLIEKELDIRIDIFGFDSGEGLPNPEDYRDLPYEWKGEFFKMDTQKLKRTLKKAELILGDVKITVPNFLETSIRFPIAFVSFDLDFYSSTVSALNLFSHKDIKKYIPRVICCFDSTSNDRRYLCSYVGEPAARTKFNSINKSRKICKLEYLSYRRKLPKLWNEKIFICHFFDHDDYNKYTNPSKTRQLTLNNNHE